MSHVDCPSVSLSVCVLQATPVSSAQTAEPIEMPLEGTMYTAHWRHLANTTARSVCGCDAPCVQITSITCDSLLAKLLSSRAIKYDHATASSRQSGRVSVDAG